MEILNRVHASNLVHWAKEKPQVLVLSADLTSSCEADLFKDSFPDRFISCGIAEQNAISVAGGLCREGFVPFFHTFGVFIYRRAYDQVAMSVAYPNLPVKMLGFLPGIITPGGATHQAIDDIALMTALPNMTVLEVGDATEVESVLEVAWQVPGPVYVRMLRGQLPRLFGQHQPMTLDCPRILAWGSDLLVVSSGICTEEALRAASVLQKKGVSLTLVHVSTLKPFDNPIWQGLFEGAGRGIISMENHLVTGGLGSILASRCFQYGIKRPMVKLGIKDCFSHGASRPYLMKHHGMDAMALVAASEHLLGCDLGIKEEDLAQVRLEPVHSLAKAEAL